MSPALRGIFLTSKEPELTAKFYRDVAGLELEQIGDSEEYVYWKVDKAGLQALRITPYATDDDVVTVADPDGRKVMFGTG
jgi:C4-dicarboxylate-specific signal transduction histidine kinase